MIGFILSIVAPMAIVIIPGGVALFLYVLFFDHPDGLR